MSLHYCVRLIATVCLFCLIFPLGSLSQTELASLPGTIRDPQGAVIPGVEVQITRLDTEIVTTSVANEAGIPQISPGINGFPYREGESRRPAQAPRWIHA